MKSMLLTSIVALAATLSQATQIDNSYGAVYFLTNEPTGNQIIATDIGADGTLSYGCVTDTGGLGGTQLPVFPDPTQSQGLVTVSWKAGLLAAANPGSNTVSLFAINKQHPSKLTPIGAPVSTVGDFPVSVTINDDGTIACTLTSGASNGITCYTIDPVNGLVPPANPFRSIGFFQTNPPNMTLTTTSQLQFSKDGSRVIAAVKGGTDPSAFAAGFLASWTIDENAVLSDTFVKSPGGAGFPFSFTHIQNPNKDAYISADPFVGFDIFDFTNQTVGVSVQTPPIPGNNLTCWTSYSPATGNYYLTDPFVDLVHEVQINDDLTSNVVTQHALPLGSGPLDAEIGNVNGVDILYALSVAVPGVVSLALYGPGQAQVLQVWNGTENGLDLNINNLQGLAVYIRNWD